MRFTTIGNKADSVKVTVHSAESSASMPVGTPVCFVMNGTNDGLDVVLPSTGGATKAHALAAGVIVTPTGLSAGNYGEALAYGYAPSLLITRATRAASTDSWTSSASIASYVLLSIDTVNNAMLVGATQAVTAFLPFAVLCQSVASMAASASATSDSRTAITASVKAFVRMI